MSDFCRQSAVALLLTAALVAPAVPCSAGDRLSVTPETVLQVERILKRAAVTSSRWHHKRESIERDVYDITYLLDEAVKSAAAGNRPATHDFAQQALTLLQRAVRVGHFDAGEIAPVLAVIQRLLPNPTA